MSKKLAALLFAAALPLGAQAATETWDIAGGDLSSSHGYGNHLTADGQSGNDLTITGWSDTGGNNDDILEQGSIRKYNGGIGMYNYDHYRYHEYNGQYPALKDDHTIDNIGNDSDMVLLSFDTAVTLSQVSIGWIEPNTTTDLTVVGYKGGDNLPDLAGQTWNNVKGNNPTLWETVFQKLDVSGYTSYAVNTTTLLSSKYWLIGACNEIFNSICKDGRCNGGGFKLTAVKADTPNGGGEVPTPASILLVFAGLLAMLRSSKNKKAHLAA